MQDLIQNGGFGSAIIFRNKKIESFEDIDEIQEILLKDIKSNNKRYEPDELTILNYKLMEE